MNINLHKALKIKNRIVGELKRLRTIAERENSRRDDSPSRVNLSEVYNEINDTLSRLVDIKTRICQANVAIYRTIETMKEAKSEMEFYRGLNTAEGTQTSHPSLYEIKNSIEPKIYRIVAHVNQDGVDNKLASLQKEINALQDVIDDYNARTIIQWED